MLLNVLLLSPTEVLYEGRAKVVIVPGESGVFEVLAFHKRILSRLISGTLYIDEQAVKIKRGVAKVDQNTVTMIVEEG